MMQSKVIRSTPAAKRADNNIMLVVMIKQDPIKPETPPEVATALEVAKEDLRRYVRGMPSTFMNSLHKSEAELLESKGAYERLVIAAKTDRKKSIQVRLIRMFVRELEKTSVVKAMHP